MTNITSEMCDRQHARLISEYLDCRSNEALVALVGSMLSAVASQADPVADLEKIEKQVQRLLKRAIEDQRAVATLRAPRLGGCEYEEI